MDAVSQLRNIKDFLMIYNRMSEHCFTKCATNFNYRSMTPEESTCVHNCASVFQKTNMRLMNQFMKLSPQMVQRRQEEAQKKYEAAMTANEAISEQLETNSNSVGAVAADEGQTTSVDNVEVADLNAEPKEK